METNIKVKLLRPDIDYLLADFLGYFHLRDIYIRERTRWANQTLEYLFYECICCALLTEIPMFVHEMHLYRY